VFDRAVCTRLATAALLRILPHVSARSDVGFGLDRGSRAPSSPRTNKKSPPTDGLSRRFHSVGSKEWGVVSVPGGSVCLSTERAALLLV
jgi:hypothetical protein